MDTAATDTLLGQRIFGGYEVTKRIGAGGMGAVYLAENKGLGRKLAVKVLLAERSHSAHAVARFLAEAKAASAIRHRNIIDVLDTALLPDGRHYILMEYLEGATLRSFARQNYPLTLEIVLAVLGQVCAGLQAAHDRGIIHRDLKPSNIVVSPQPDNPYLTKILDFGIAKLAAPDLTSDAHTKSRTVAGTPYYMSPEQARALRDVDNRTDIYAVGVIAYEMVTGRPPYMATSAGDLVYQQQTSKPKQPVEMCPGLPPAWNQLILDAIDLDAERRPQSARALAQRMIDATERGPDIARATAPLLFTRPSEHLTGSDSQPLVPDWSQASMPVSSSPARPPGTEAPPPRPAATEAPPPASASSFPPSSSEGSKPPAPQLLEHAHPSLPPVPGSLPPHATRDLRSGSGSYPVVEPPTALRSRPGSVTGPPRPSLTGPPGPPSVTGPPRPPSEGVPTTLGMTASEIPVYEGTMMTGTQSRRGRRWPLALVLLGLVAGIGGGVLLLAGQGKGDRRPASQPQVEEEPEVTPVPTAVPIDDDKDPEPAAVIVDAGVPDAAPEPPDAAPKKATRKSGGNKTRVRSKPDAAPVSDDDLFDSRK
jgi:serine/threonine-protein kinase